MLKAVLHIFFIIATIIPFDVLASDRLFFRSNVKGFDERIFLSMDEVSQHELRTRIGKEREPNFMHILRYLAVSEVVSFPNESSRIVPLSEQYRGFYASELERVSPKTVLLGHKIQFSYETRIHASAEFWLLHDNEMEAALSYIDYEVEDLVLLLTAKSNPELTTTIMSGPAFVSLVRSSAVLVSSLSGSSYSPHEAAQHPFSLLNILKSNSLEQQIIEAMNAYEADAGLPDDTQLVLKIKASQKRSQSPRHRNDSVLILNRSQLESLRLKHRSMSEQLIQASSSCVRSFMGGIRTIFNRG